jgi:uncharacterized protein with PIN domain
MRAMVEPPPSSRCTLCGGDLRLKLVESADHILGRQKEIFLCAKCGHQHSYAVDSNPYETPSFLRFR